MKLIFTISTICLFHMTVGQDLVDIRTCLAQKKVGYVCVKKVLEGFALNERNAKREQLLEKNRKCFADNGCEHPTSRLERVQECKRNVFEELVKPELEKCSKFTIPAAKSDRLSFGKRIGHHYRVKEEEEVKLEEVEKFCSVDGDASAVYDCLEQIKRDAEEVERKVMIDRAIERRDDSVEDSVRYLIRQMEEKRRKEQEMAARRKERDQKVKKCYDDNFMKDCRKLLSHQMRNVNRIICDCAEDLKNNETLADNIEKAMKDCGDEEDDDDKPSHVEEMVNIFCPGRRRPRPGPTSSARPRERVNKPNN